MLFRKDFFSLDLMDNREGMWIKTRFGIVDSKPVRGSILSES